MGDLNTPDIDIIQKRLIINIDDQILGQKKLELRQMELLQEIKRLEVDKESSVKAMKKFQDELALYNKPVKSGEVN